MQKAFIKNKISTDIENRLLDMEGRRGAQTERLALISIPYHVKKKRASRKLLYSPGSSAQCFVMT